MREEIYDYLRQYGFSQDEVNSIKDRNEKIYFAFISDITPNTDFLENLGFSKNEIISLINSNPFFITCSNKRRDAFNKIYMEDLEYTKEELKKMLLVNPYMYILSPIDVDILVKDLLKTYTKEELKNIILNNPNLLNGNEQGAE